MRHYASTIGRHNLLSFCLIQIFSKNLRDDLLAMHERMQGNIIINTSGNTSKTTQNHFYLSVALLR